MKVEVISFRSLIDPDDRVTFKERLKDGGFVQEIRIRFYPGLEKSLQISPFVLHKENRREDLFTFVGSTDNFISGDDDYFVFPVSIEFAYDDELAVEVYNNNSIYPYTMAVDIIVSYSGV